MATPADFHNDPNKGFWWQEAQPPNQATTIDIFHDGQFIESGTRIAGTTTKQAFDRWIAKEGNEAGSQWYNLYQAEEQAYTQKFDAFSLLERIFTQYGLASLVPKIKDYIIAGNTGDTIALQLAETQEYKTRFSGNEIRKTKGLAVLSPAEYIGMEGQYKDLFRQYGLPTGLYDSASSISTYLGNDVSASEMDGRLQIARKTVRSDNPSTRDAYMRWYAAGMTEGDAIAAVLDPSRAIPELERKQRSAGILGAANWHGLGEGTGGVDIGVAELLGDRGVTEDDANRGFAAIKQFVKPTQEIARRYKTDYTITDAESEVFFNAASSREKREKLYNREISEFSGSQQASAKSFGQGRY